MHIYLKAQGVSMWNSIISSWTKLKNDEKEWTTDEMHVYTAKYKALSAIVCAVSQEEFQSIYNLEMAKEAWKLHEVTYEGINIVKQSKL